MMGMKPTENKKILRKFKKNKKNKETNPYFLTFTVSFLVVLP